MNLTTALNDWSNRPELASQHATFIELAEAAISVRLHERLLEGIMATAIVGGQVTLLTNVTEVIGVRLQDNTEVEIRPLEEVLTRKKGATIAAIVGRQIFFSQSSGQVTIRVKNTIPTVSTGDTNWLLTNFPNVYLSACLVELYAHLRNHEERQAWQARMDEAIALVNSTMLYRGTAARARFAGSV